MRKIILSIITIALCTITVTAQEDSSDFKKWQVRLRALAVVPDAGAEIGLIGGNIAIETVYIPELDISYYFTNNISVELILGTSKHHVNTVASDLSGIGLPTSFDVDLGSVRLLPPTLLLQYHFNGEKVRPYVGAGINYTLFYDVDPGDVVADVSYNNALGFAAQLGVDYDISDRLFLNMDLKYLFLNTDVTVDATNLHRLLSIPAEVDINPFIAGIGIGMRF